MVTLEWDLAEAPESQGRRLCDLTRRTGFLVVVFPETPAGGTLPWPVVQPWTRSRAVTVADVRGTLRPPTLELAVCSDLVYLRSGAALDLGAGTSEPSQALVWALARAGPRALRRGLLEPGILSADEAVELELAHASVETGATLPLPLNYSRDSLTAARDLLRARAGGGAGLQLELATFRLMFATGAPAEGAAAFLEDREARFDDRLGD